MLMLNGSNLGFTKDYTLIQVCNFIGLGIPRFCYNGLLILAGNCRSCLLEALGGVKPLVGCTSKAISNIGVYTESPLVKKSRESVIEFLLISHPSDCPICDQGGECDLQEYSERFGGDETRYSITSKRTLQDKNFGVFCKTIMSRCILCTRCVRLLVGTALFNFIGVAGRGIVAEISMFFSNVNSNDLLVGNIIDVCPVGFLPKISVRLPYLLSGRRV
jgi:NADH-quinone oxidoreductase subunit G